MPTTSFSAIEEAAMAAGRDAAKEVMVQAIERLEVGRARGSRRSRYGRARTVLTTAGFITIRRGRARRPDGTLFFPLDERLGLHPHHEASAAARARGCALAAEHPYREAARLLGM